MQGRVDSTNPFDCVDGRGRITLQQDLRGERKVGTSFLGMKSALGNRSKERSELTLGTLNDTDKRY